jgi:hypothetical protein
VEVENVAPARPDPGPGRGSKLAAKIAARFAPPPLTSGRIWFAFTVAVITDSIQLGLGPVGWAFADESLDVIAMVLTCVALGFHMLLLPTFVIEFIPVADMLPTWTGCVGAVVMLRKRAQSRLPPTVQVSASPPPVPPSHQISGETRGEQPVNNGK